ncbi:A disintegrin and metalloproteinase with thrombospondin motifs 7-like [Lethenteron reissneri]|uniref:A disintegrin and metalloproteinase with thrombospondin motifs 7-like n=1 Tax=Lethenteron reissneri TaxID=7753 RepID=UPI002AB60F72|nr:A disintegrin and metalloproteinase with thrombospondin motifs 7-like [Lethenteron reissneri]
MELPRRAIATIVIIIATTITTSIIIITAAATTAIPSATVDSVFPDNEQGRSVRRQDPDFQVTVPVRLTSRAQRDVGPRGPPLRYLLSHHGKRVRLDLRPNQALLAPGFVLEIRSGEGRSQIRVGGPPGLPGLPRGSDGGHGDTEGDTERHTGDAEDTAGTVETGGGGCHYLGWISEGKRRTGTAAVSSCGGGLTGLLRLPAGDYFIEPVRRARRSHVEGRETPVEGGAGSPHPGAHVIYKRGGGHGSPPNSGRNGTVPAACGVHDSPRAASRTDRRRERWQQGWRQRSLLRAAAAGGPRRRVGPRSVSKERWVETMVVADAKMVEHHGEENIEAYVLTVVNMVAGLFRDASIGNPINVVLVRMVLLTGEEEELKVVHHADLTLHSFCKWQKSVNPKGEGHHAHHDAAVLLTRKDLCAGMNRPCETLGLSHMAGMCQPHRSCNINEDTGLPLAFTMAHELGHSFGIQHDGQGNACEARGKRPSIMSPQLTYSSRPLSWSSCSRDYVTRFLDRGWGFCLDDPPSPRPEPLVVPTAPPGALYDAPHQCRLQYGEASRHCRGMDNVCHTLWCTVGDTCHSKLDAAADGTRCDHGKWCYYGECVSTDWRPERIPGGWGSWGAWTPCTRSCGGGVESAERLCDSPTPRGGGRYCTGERRRYRLCHTAACPAATTMKAANKTPSSSASPAGPGRAAGGAPPSFRALQCSRFDKVPYKGRLHSWIPVISPMNPCELHCQPVGEHFTEKLLDAAVDGTPCADNPNARDICINGICKHVGCDLRIDSLAVEDRCGVCMGDGSTCRTVKKTFNDSEGLGYVDIDRIPAGARDIVVEEVEEAGNFLALRSDAEPARYFLNGGWVIQWRGDYAAGGATFTYWRRGNLENLTATGPTREPVWIQLLFQESNPGIRYEYTVHQPPHGEGASRPREFAWRYGPWGSCTAPCGRGVQRQEVHCTERTAGPVEERLCDDVPRPDDRQRACNEHECPARWWVGEWQGCPSPSCGSRPTAGASSEETEEEERRSVLCVRGVGADEHRALPASQCEGLPRPPHARPCPGPPPCPTRGDVPAGDPRGTWLVGGWSPCSATCGAGVRSRDVRCERRSGDDVCDEADRPAEWQRCDWRACAELPPTTGPAANGTGGTHHGGPRQDDGGDDDDEDDDREDDDGEIGRREDDDGRDEDDGEGTESDDGEHHGGNEIDDNDDADEDSDEDHGEDNRSVEDDRHEDDGDDDNEDNRDDENDRDDEDNHGEDDDDDGGHEDNHHGDDDRDANEHHGDDDHDDEDDEEDDGDDNDENNRDDETDGDDEDNHGEEDDDGGHEENHHGDHDRDANKHHGDDDHDDEDDEEDDGDDRHDEGSDHQHSEDNDHHDTVHREDDDDNEEDVDPDRDGDVAPDERDHHQREETVGRGAKDGEHNGIDSGLAVDDDDDDNNDVDTEQDVEDQGGEVHVDSNAIVVPNDIKRLNQNLRGSSSSSSSSSDSQSDDASERAEWHDPPGEPRGRPPTSTTSSSPSNGSTNAKKKNLIDIYYYDYNFISFHEDLLYDLDEAGTGATREGQSQQPADQTTATTTTATTTTATTATTATTSASLPPLPPHQHRYRTTTPAAPQSPPSDHHHPTTAPPALTPHQQQHSPVHMTPNHHYRHHGASAGNFPAASQPRAATETDSNRAAFDVATPPAEMARGYVDRAPTTAGRQPDGDGRRPAGDTVPDNRASSTPSSPTVTGLASGIAVERAVRKAIGDAAAGDGSSERETPGESRWDGGAGGGGRTLAPTGTESPMPIHEFADKVLQARNEGDGFGGSAFSPGGPGARPMAVAATATATSAHGARIRPEPPTVPSALPGSSHERRQAPPLAGGRGEGGLAASSSPVSSSSSSSLSSSSSSPSLSVAFPERAGETSRRAEETRLPEASWRVTPWSECSATCGLGVARRSVWCASRSRSGSAHCDFTQRPPPARRCSVRPCVAWHAGNWSECSRRGCGLPRERSRAVLCVDARSRRSVRPQLCSALGGPRLATTEREGCPPLPCLPWATSAWGPNHARPPEFRHRPPPMLAVAANQIQVTGFDAQVC